jgi:hypothetical protein
LAHKALAHKALGSWGKPREDWLERGDETALTVLAQRAHCATTRSSSRCACVGASVKNWWHARVLACVRACVRAGR